MSDLSEEDFDALEDRVEQLAKAAPAPFEGHPGADPHHHADAVHNEEDFEALVSAALDGLPPDVIAQLDNVAIVVSDEGAKNKAYGTYWGASVVRKGAHVDFWDGGNRNQITIFRDTLVRDFGHDPKLLKSKVTETVRHEVGHYLGMSEEEVGDTGV